MHGSTVKRVIFSIVLGWTISWAIGLAILISAFLLGFAKNSFSYPLKLYVAIFAIVTVFSYLKLNNFSRIFMLFLIILTVLLPALMVVVISQNPDVRGVGFIIEVTPWSVHLGKP